MRTERLRLRVLNFIGYTDSDIPSESEGAVTYVNDPSNGKTIKFNDGTSWVDAFGGDSGETADLSTDYSPLEDSPEWAILSGGTSSGLDITGGEIRVITTPTGGDTAVYFGTVNAEDVKVLGTFVAGIPSADILSIVMGVRIVDSSNFIGIRPYRGEIQLYERVGGGFTLLGSVPLLSTEENVELSVVGSDVTLVYNGTTVNVTTTHLAAGNVGVVSRLHLVGIIPVLNHFSVLDLT